MRKKLAKPKATDALPSAADSIAEPVQPSAPTVQMSSAVLKFADSLVVGVRKKLKDTPVALASTKGAVVSEVKEWIPTGFVGLDMLTGGGWPVGRCSEVAGEEGSGKSAISQRACVETQRMGGIVVYLDFERALDPKKMERLGLNPNGLIYLAPDYIEQGWDVVWSITDQLIAKPPPAPTLFVWDSVGGSLAKSQFESSAEDAHVGAVSRVMTPNCAKLFTKIARCRAHMIFVNQERAAIGKFARFGPPPKSTTGGAGLKYAASIRMRCARVMTIKAGGTSGPATGYLVKMTTDKCRLVPPHRKATWVLDFGVGPSPELTVFEALKDGGKLKPAGPGMFSLRGYSGAPVNRSGWIERFREDTDFYNHAHALYVALIREGFSGVKAEVETDES